jgi:hypothetical protein
MAGITRKSGVKTAGENRAAASINYTAKFKAIIK